tara:strand:- start:1148 stop:1264 length:117 start_codon:yes stop_codon:yes gene_type:complete
VENIKKKDAKLKEERNAEKKELEGVENRVKDGANSHII